MYSHYCQNLSYLGLPLTTLTVTSTPLSRRSTHGPAFSNQTSITLISLYHSDMQLIFFALILSGLCHLTAIVTVYLAQACVCRHGAVQTRVSARSAYRTPQRYLLTLIFFTGAYLLSHMTQVNQSSFLFIAVQTHFHAVQRYPLTLVTDFSTQVHIFYPM